MSNNTSYVTHTRTALIPLITCHRTSDSFAHSIEMPTHNFVGSAICHSFTMPPYTFRPLDSAALRSSVLYVQTHPSARVCEMCRYLYRNKCTTSIFQLKISLHLFSYIFFFPLNAVSPCHQRISPGKAQKTSTFFCR